MEFNVLKSSEVKSENVTFRFDAEFFRKEYIQIVRQVKSNKFSFIYDLCSWVTQGPNPIFSETGIPCLTGRNINKGEVSYVDTDYINKEEYLGLSRYQLRVGDTLITLKGKGSIGKVGFVTNDRKAIFSRDIGIIRPLNIINPGYLNVFFLCKYGKLLVDRGETGGTGQSTLTTSYLKCIPVPRFGELEELIGSILNKVEILKRSSSDKYSDAESCILSELCISDWHPEHQRSFVNQYSDTVKAGRIDAEYFQPKYDEIVKAIKGYPGGCDTLGNLVKSRNKNVTPLDKKEYKYIELSNIAGNGEITDCMVEEGQNLPSRARRKVATGDVIVSSIEGSLSSIALIEKEYNQSLCSTGFHVINSKSFNSETLLVLLKSMVGQLQLKKGCSGTILTAINKDEFNKVILPKVDGNVQSQIQQKITESFNLRKLSKHLLECAKRAVEIAIEQNEDVAVNWLRDQTKEAVS